MRKWVEKSEAIMVLLDSLSNYCIWCFFFISSLMKSSVVYAAILFTHVCKMWDNDLTEYQVCYKLTDI